MKIVLGSILIFSAIYFGIYLFSYIGILDIPETQYSASATKALKNKTASRESVLSYPVAVEWTGEIFGVLQSGNGYAIKSLDQKAQYPQFMAFWPRDKMEWLDGNVRIKGLMEGIDCAYQNTIFGGECVPLITITTLKIIKE